MFSFIRSARESLMPVLKESHFQSNGMVTPEEFVKSGDLLVSKCRTWRWCSGESARIRTYLPADKQFLLIQGCLSTKRVKDVTSPGNMMVDNNDEMVEGGWMATSAPEGNRVAEDDDLAGVLVEADAPSRLQTENKKSTRESDSEYLDMEDSDLALDSNTTDTFVNLNELASAIQARRYDISITYDNYYRTPRVWLLGYDDRGNPLGSKLIFEDIMPDYVNKTVTIESHPHLGTPQLSIHPCQHAATMKCIIDSITDSSEIPVDNYLFIFLKFIQSVIPSIDYDYTTSVKISGSSK